MKTGICNLPMIPLRSDPSERSEMVSQLLFGELVVILETYESWFKVKNFSDQYMGWCTSKMLQEIPDSLFEALSVSKPFLLKEPLTLCKMNSAAGSQLFLPFGSRLYHWNDVSATFTLFCGNAVSGWKKEAVSVVSTKGLQPLLRSENGLIGLALLFLQAPYLWGGKSILGVDCSGLMQLVFSIYGLGLPRDACDQELLGERVPSIEEARAGDLAFFSNDSDRVVHVGLLVDSHRIVHASGCVHIDPVDATGIFSESLGKYTHFLHSLKRVYLL